MVGLELLKIGVRYWGEMRHCFSWNRPLSYPKAAA